MKKNILTKKEILHLTRLANLNLKKNSLEKYRQQLGETVKYVANLRRLNTKKTLPTFQTTNLSNIFFEDGEINKRAFSQKEALAMAKRKKNGYFIVEKIM